MFNLVSTETNSILFFDNGYHRSVRTIFTVKITKGPQKNPPTPDKKNLCKNCPPSQNHCYPLLCLRYCWTCVIIITLAFIIDWRLVQPFVDFEKTSYFHSSLFEFVQGRNIKSNSTCCSIWWILHLK